MNELASKNHISYSATPKSLSPRNSPLLVLIQNSTLTTTPYPSSLFTLILRLHGGEFVFPWTLYVCPVFTSFPRRFGFCCFSCTHVNILNNPLFSLQRSDEKHNPRRVQLLCFYACTETPEIYWRK